MATLLRVALCWIVLAASAFCQSFGFPYVFKTIAGTFPLGDHGTATVALLNYPDAVMLDSSGNIYIADSYDYLIRKVANGVITSAVTLGAYPNDIKLGPDGNFYIAAKARVYKVTPSGAMTIVAGTGAVGSNGDGGLAVSAQVGNVLGICLDATGNIFITESNKVREITTDGYIKTVAGTGVAGYNGDNISATAARLYDPIGIAVDGSGNLYVADSANSRVRKISAQGTITTILGNGTLGYPSKTAASSMMGVPASVTLDLSGNIYVTDTLLNLVLKISSGTLSLLAGDYDAYDSPSDGSATGSSLQTPFGLAVDSSGNVYVADSTHRVREITTVGQIRTIAGRIHLAGDNGPATSAILNEPDDVAVDSTGNVFIADGYNFRVRKVGLDGNISTYTGTGFLGYPPEKAQASGSPIGYITSMVYDAAGNLYLATQERIVKITPAGICTTFAGNGTYADTGDGGAATKASMKYPTALAVDSLGNVYVADSDANRVRKISASDGTISAFAGTGSTGYLGDGGLASAAQLSIGGLTAMVGDRSGNIYIADSGNRVLRMVAPSGVITTVAGNGKLGVPTDGQQAKSSPLSAIESLAADKDGNIFLASADYGQIYELSNGLIRTVSGAQNNTLTEGMAAINAYFFAWGIKVDSNGDIYVADGENSAIRKLILNSPTSLTVSDGNNQSAVVGTALPRALKVLVNGRAGGPVAGIAVTFAVASGSATLSATSTLTDSTGTAGVTVTLGSTAGPVVVTASVAGTSLAPVQFTLTANSLLPAGCTASTPVVTSVASAGDFGGLSTFASGSWLEIKGSNLSTTTRQWQASDFKGSNAPASLDGVSAYINGLNGYLMYVSPTQINVQAPADSTVGSVSVTVTNCAGTSVPVVAQKAVVAPGLLSPAAFNVGGKQYLVALFGDGTTFVGAPNLIPGANFRPAAPGDAITAYGIGFGDVTPAIAPGIIVSQANSLANFTLSFGTTPATVGYFGLEPGYVGLYQFNITVPNVPDGDYLLDIRVGGKAIAQSLYLTVKQ